MIKRLIEFVAENTAAHTFKLSLQDIALCQLWHDVQSRRTPADDKGAAIVRRVETWCATPDAQDLNTAGRRHQFLLRDLIDLIQSSQRGTLIPDEASFLCMTVAIIGRTPGADQSGRVASLLKPHAETLATMRDRREPVPGLQSLERRIQYASEHDIQSAASSPIRLLAGIDLPCRGPVFKASGHLRILGDVPDNCTVVVENEGLCCVDGYVMGRVLSKRQCEIRHNISGVAIVLKGDIRARGIINNAIAISKMGGVICSNAQGPKLVFAGQSIEVTESTMLGHFITRDMSVGKEVRGSRLEIAGKASAQYFRHLGMNSVSVVLRRELSCEDFGEVTGTELKQLLSQAYALRRHARNFSHLAEAARGEADHSAQSVLMFVFGGGEVQKRLENLLRAQRRHAFISSVVGNLRNMLQDFREGAFQPGDDVSESDLTAGTPLENDDNDLKAAQDEASQFRKSLKARAMDQRQTTLLLEEAREKLAAMVTLQAQMAEQVTQEERAMQNVEKYEQILAGSGNEATKLDVLNRILPALNNQPADSTIGKRLRSGFTVRALRTIERAVRHAEEFEQKAVENLRDFRAVSERLGKDYQIRILENPEDEGSAARVTGRFDGGTRIFMDEYVENLAEVPSDAVIMTPEDDAMRTYLRSGSGTGFMS